MKKTEINTKKNGLDFWARITPVESKIAGPDIFTLEFTTKKNGIPILNGSLILCTGNEILADNWAPVMDFFENLGAELFSDFVKMIKPRGFQADLFDDSDYKNAAKELPDLNDLKNLM
jgi:hypothetical protein